MFKVKLKEIVMRKQTELLTAMAGALLAMGLSVSANASDGFVTAEYYAENAVTQMFDDGSTLQVFEDGSTLAVDSTGGIVKNTIADSGRALDTNGYAHTQVFDDGSILQTFDDGSLLAMSADGTSISAVHADSADSVTTVRLDDAAAESTAESL